jgi:hypothetical protein
MKSMGKKSAKKAAGNGVKEALKNPSNAQWSPDAAMDLSWLERRNGGCSEPPKNKIIAECEQAAPIGAAKIPAGRIKAAQNQTRSSQAITKQVQVNAK